MMIASVGERACRQVGEVHDFVRSCMRGTPTADQLNTLLEMVQQAEQLTDATAQTIAYFVAILRLGPEAQRARRLQASWEESLELEAVRVHRTKKRVIKVKRTR